MPKSRPGAVKKSSSKKGTSETKAKGSAASSKGVAKGSPKVTVKKDLSLKPKASKEAVAKKEPVKPAAKPEAPKGEAAKAEAGKGVKPAPAPVAKGAPGKPAEGSRPVGPSRPSGKREEKPTLQMPRFGAPLLKPGARPKPLIESGPSAARKQLQIDDGTQPKKTPFDKKTLERFRSMLVKKRGELIGDVSAMESQALKGSSGSLSHMPQHMAEQGTETFDQALSLDLAAADRKLIREIDDALKRIELGTYGVCELTGKPIKVERLEELPWARYSIEAARELERRATMPQVP